MTHRIANEAPAGQDAPSRRPPAQPAASVRPRGVLGSSSGPRRVWQAVVRRLAAGEGTFERPPLADVLLALALTAPAVADRLTAAGADGGWRTWVGWLLLAAMFVPLVWRRVIPALTITMTGCATGLASLLGVTASLAELLAVLVALYSVTAYGTRSDGRVSLGVSFGFIITGFVATWIGEGTFDLSQAIVTCFIFVGVWALGDRTRVRREMLAQLTARAEEAERSRELAAELAVADERRRIARELHDVVAHAVSVVVVQAGAGRRVAATDPTGAVSALRAIEATGRDALGELRRLVGVLRDDGVNGDRAPQPQLADVPAMLDRLRDAGVPVVFHDHGAHRQLPQGIEITATRIVQEALTNVLKHAGPVQHVAVTIDRRPDRLLVEVVDDGAGAPADPDASRAGTGLVGMRERVAVYGGTLRSGTRTGGGYLVRARLPLDDRMEART